MNRRYDGNRKYNIDRSYDRNEFSSTRYGGSIMDYSTPEEINKVIKVLRSYGVDAEIKYGDNFQMRGGIADSDAKSIVYLHLMSGQFMLKHWSGEHGLRESYNLMERIDRILSCLEQLKKINPELVIE